MYCSNCGKSLKENLNYCNGCGNRIENSALVVGNAASPYFAKAAGAIGLGGLVGAVFVLKLLLGSSLDPRAIIVIMVAYLLTVSFLFTVLVGHVWKHSGDIRIKRPELPEPDAFPQPTSFRSPTTAQLEEAREPVMSVTENTTRTLDHVPFSGR